MLLAQYFVGPPVEGWFEDNTIGFRILRSFYWVRILDFLEGNPRSGSVLPLDLEVPTR